MTAPTYTTIGSVRGSCGHAHRTLSAAQACADADQRACRRRFGYSDRVVRRSDGSPLSEQEAEALEG
jgi:hypothetical protein